MKTTLPMKPTLARYGQIEMLESRIAPAAVISTGLPTDLSKYVAVTSGGDSLVTAGEVLSTAGGGVGTGYGGGTYLLYVESGQVLVHTTDLNQDHSFEVNEITGLSVSAGARFTLFTDVHGDIVTDLLPNGHLTDSDNNASNGRDGRVLLDANINGITLRSLTPADFAASGTASPSSLVLAHLAPSSYSVYGNIYAGGGLGVADDTTSGLHIDTSGASYQSTVFSGTNVTHYVSVQPQVGNIYAGNSAAGQTFTFGVTNSASDIGGTLLPFKASPNEPGASIYNIAAVGGQAFNVGVVHAGDGGYNAAGGNIVNAALNGDNSGGYSLIAGNAGAGPNGHAGGSIINYSEAGTITGFVTLQSGNGGQAYTGVGGNGGMITFNPAAPIAVNAHFAINYGKGGDGYAGGGNGAGLSTGTFITPEGQLTNATVFVSTWHQIGTIGSTQSFDFNGDGYSDAVYATVNPNQLVVAFGDGGQGGTYAFDSTQSLYLNGPGNISSIVVGDFNGDGHPDIAVASSNPGFVGVEVFLSQYSAKGAFTGFSAPLITPLPDISSYAGTDSQAYPVTKLAAGDFNGDGITDIALVTQEIALVSNKVEPIALFLNGAINHSTGLGNGYFYADFSGYNLQQNYALPFFTLPDANAATVIFKPTALQTFTPGQGHDVVVEAAVGKTSFNILDNGSNPDGTMPVGGSKGNNVVLSQGGAYGKVDTSSRTDATAKPALTQFTALDLTVTQDQLNPNLADVVALGQAPAGYLVTFAGDGKGNFAVTSTGDPANGQKGAGIEFGSNDLLKNVGPVAIVTVPHVVETGGSVPYPVDPTTTYSDVAILGYANDSTHSNLVFVINLNSTNSASTGQPVVEVTTGGFNQDQYWSIYTPNNQNTNYVAFDTYNPHPTYDPNLPGSGPFEFGFVVGNQLSSFKYTGEQSFDVAEPEVYGVSAFHDVLSKALNYKTSGFFVTAGAGGNSLAGHGGSGGSLGQSLTTTNVGGVISAVGSFNITLPVEQAYEGTAVLTAGAGGNGFTGGGNGGSTIGLSVNYAGTVETGQVELIAANGGQSLTGAGGNGGSIEQMAIHSGYVFIAGNGGAGVSGGAGGSVIGTKIPGLTTLEASASTSDVLVFGGIGGTGLTHGGSGGNIDTFNVYFEQELYAVGGTIVYVAGDAGDAVAGHAGTGGSVLNSSPEETPENNLAGDITLQGGKGGSGLYGGAGGSILNFVDKPSIPQLPTAFTAVAGKGGSSVFGTGGTGGSINTVSVPTSGTGISYLNSTANNIVEAKVTYDRVVAGSGGNSLAGAGGAGGSVASLNATAASALAQCVVAAGKGGDGLTAGGLGGSVLSTSVSAGSSQDPTMSGKVLVVAGDGGSSYSYKPNTLTTAGNVAYALGNVNGPGGNGGSIADFNQGSSVNTHYDFIAGNGGNTLGHSAAADQLASDNSGKGGSATNINVVGDIGNVDTTTAIKSYNDFVGGQTMQQFIDSYVLGSLSLSLNDSVGNVGLVVGAAGRVGSDLAPSLNGVNGSGSNIHARDIMSIIAGSVDQVAAVQSLTNYGVNTGDVLGADKSGPSALDPAVVGSIGALDYLDANGNLVQTVIPGGGALLDGAIWAKNNRVTQGLRDFNGTI